MLLWSTSKISNITKNWNLLVNIIWDSIKFLTKAKNYYFDQLAKYLPKIEIYWYNYSHNFQIIKPTENQRKTNNIVRYDHTYPLQASANTRPSANSGHNARNFCKNGVTTIFQVAIWTICELLVQPRKGFEWYWSEYDPWVHFLILVMDIFNQNSGQFNSYVRLGMF